MTTPGPRPRLALALATVLLGGGRLAARDDALGKAQIQDMGMRASAWVVALSPHERGQASMGTGALVLADGKGGFVITNAHVVGKKKEVRVTFPWFKGGQAPTDRKFYGREMPLEGTVVALDPDRDLALIQVGLVPHGIRPLKLARESPAPGEHVYLVGNPGAEQLLWRANEATVKRVGARDTLFKGETSGTEPVLLDLTAQDDIKPGYSGGPVLNPRGELVGIVFAAQVADAHQGLAVDVREVRDVVLLARQHPTRAQAVLTPGGPADYRDRGNYYLSREEFDRAIASLTKAIDLQENVPGRLYYLRALARRKKGDARAAIADLTEAIARDARDAASYRERGACFLVAEDYDRAIADYSKAIQLDPKDARAYAGRGQAYVKKGEPDKAREDRQRAVQLDPTLDRP
jgi:tetratricopeptide (TPR) repeat protein